MEPPTASKIEFLWYFQLYDTYLNMTTKFSFNTIYIIESLFEGDKKTGQNLYNDLIKWRTLKEDNLHSKLFTLEHKLDFYKVFNEIQAEIAKGFSPFIHFEVHGASNKDGIILASKELIKWEELAEETRKINIATKNNLAISLATCYGAYFIKTIDIKKVAPFSCCVSAIDKIKMIDVEVDFTSFFETVLASTDFNAAVDALNKTVSYKYHFFSAELFFEQVYKEIEDGMFNLETLKSRRWINQLTKKTMQIQIDTNRKKTKKNLRLYINSQKEKMKADARRVFLMK